MNRLLLAAVAALILVATSAQAGTQLQLQFQRWSYNGDGFAQLLVTLRNPTMKPFATVSWSCDLYDKEKRLVGQTAIVFHVVPWGSLIVDTVPVATNGMFEDGECRLIETEEVTYRNERLYRGSPFWQVIGLGLPEANRMFNFDARIQGRAQVITKEEDDRLEKMQKAGQLKDTPGYRAQ